MKALILDDSAAMRAILRGMLAKLGLDTLEAESAPRALEVLGGRDDVDLVLVDWNLDGMSGLDFVRSVRERSRERPRLMMVTTELDQDRVQSALDAGADEYLMKPFTGDAVREKLTLMGFEVPGPP